MNSGPGRFNSPLVGEEGSWRAPEPSNSHSPHKIRTRWLVIWAAAVIWTAALTFRLGDLQLYRYSDYLARAQKQQERSFEVSPARGTIYDRNGHELAVSTAMDSLFADPADIHDPAMVARLVAPILGDPAEEIEDKIREARTPVRLARKVSPEIVSRISAMNLRGVFFEPENRRVYPHHELAAHVVGYVDTDEKGQGGVEHSLDKLILGRPGRVLVMADGHRQYYDRRESAPDPGASVTLTIDETIQYIAEKELATSMQETHALSGSVLVQDPNTGELLAVANGPTYDPNSPGNYASSARQDRAVTDAYEPGSTFKTITMTAAIENGVTNPADLIDCQMGSIQVAGRTIHDWHPFGVLSVRDVLADSSDVGSIKIALRLGATKFYQTIRAFGIGQLTGIALPAENRGLLRPLAEWRPASIASIAIGQEVSVTPIQIITAVSAVANGGTLYPPRIIKEIRNPGGDLAPPVKPGTETHVVTDPRTAATVREMMEAVILEGTGKPAQLEGYTAAGKSGTAQKIDKDTGHYSPNHYVASFVGFAPLNNPAIAVLVVLDSPEGPHHGGEVGGPVFKRVAEQILAYLDVPRDVPLPSLLETARNSPVPPNLAAASQDSTEAAFQAAVAKHSAGQKARAETVALGKAPMASLPDFSGETVREVIESCSREGLVPELIGDGVALEQDPAAGSQLPPGGRVTVRFGRPGDPSTPLRQGAQN
jgi:cell division protein FtsI (penicillin-binding protein 3)